MKTRRNVKARIICIDIIKHYDDALFVKWQAVDGKDVP